MNTIDGLLQWIEIWCTPESNHYIYRYLFVTAGVVLLAHTHLITYVKQILKARLYLSFHAWSLNNNLDLHCLSPGSTLHPLFHSRSEQNITTCYVLYGHVNWIHYHSSIKQIKERACVRVCVRVSVCVCACVRVCERSYLPFRSFDIHESKLWNMTYFKWKMSAIIYLFFLVDRNV